jgi:flagellum-specific peptidoglycan hydrolase FlgJ
MEKQLAKNMAILAVALVLFVFIVREIFKGFDLSLKDYPKFNYTGQETVKRWIKYSTPLAKAVGKQYGIPWQAIVVHTGLETGWGKSSLLQKYNNVGGIKDTDGINSTEPLSTVEYYNGNRTEIKDGFEISKTPYEGFVYYAQFFHRLDRYSNALKYPNDPYKFISEIKKAGYATDPNYVAKLHKLLNENFA